MTFLSPTILWGLLAAAIPVLIHLLSLRNTREIEFSSIKFIKALEHETIRHLKLRQWLLVIIRTLIIIFLVLMFARPVQRGFAVGWMAGEQEAQVVLIVDNSASVAVKTDNGSLLDIAKQAANQSISLFEGQTKVDIYQTNPARRVFSGTLNEPDNIRNALEGISQTESEDDLWGVVDTILAGYEFREPNQECFIFSDFQRRPKPGFLTAAGTDTIETNWRIYCVALPAMQSNLSIRNVTPLNQVRMSNSLLKLNTSIHNDGRVSQSNVPVELYLNDERVGQVISDFDPQRSRDFLFQAYPGQDGIINGRLTIPHDDFHLDNEFTFETIIPDEINAMIVGGSDVEIHLLRTALRSIDQNMEFLFVETRLDSQPRALALDNIDVLIMYNPGTLSQPVVDEITSFLEAGGGIIWFNGDRCFEPGYARIEQAFNLPHPRQSVHLEGEAYYSVLTSDPDHPLLSDLDLLNLQNELPQVFGYVDVSLNRSHHSVLSIDNGRPLLIDFKPVGGRIFLFSSLLDLRWNDLGLRGLVVPLLHRMLMLLATDESLVQPVEVDQEKIVPLERELLNKQWELITPSNKHVLLIPDYSSESLLIDATGEVGSYQVLMEGQLFTNFSVVLSKSEYPSQRSGEGTIIDRLPADQARWISIDENYLDNLKDIRFGKSLWRTFLILAIILLLVESAIGRFRPGSIRKSTDAD